ncbi:hypothetical protein [Amycolatopsis plumensis]|uniref:hypothetical protein n=1 Tax=Amycolatopsis plumensis TaxID=236508 RepID=UPI0036127850
MKASLGGTVSPRSQQLSTALVKSLASRAPSTRSRTGSRAARTRRMKAKTLVPSASR